VLIDRVDRLVSKHQLTELASDVQRLRDELTSRVQSPSA